MGPNFKSHSYVIYEETVNALIQKNKVDNIDNQWKETKIAVAFYMYKTKDDVNTIISNTNYWDSAKAIISPYISCGKNSNVNCQVQLGCTS